MSKAALASMIAAEFQLPKVQAAKIVDKIFDGITSALVSQGSFSYMGFGRLQVVDRAPRKGRNPGTGKELEIGARKVVKFTSGENLKREINPQKTQPAAKGKGTK
jgi:DNA-binding protein HU-beta